MQLTAGSFCHDELRNEEIRTGKWKGGKMVDSFSSLNLSLSLYIYIFLYDYMYLYFYSSFCLSFSFFLYNYIYLYLCLCLLSFSLSLKSTLFQLTKLPTRNDMREKVEIKRKIAIVAWNSIIRTYTRLLPSRCYRRWIVSYSRQIMIVRST